MKRVLSVLLLLVSTVAVLPAQNITYDEWVAKLKPLLEYKDEKGVDKAFNQAPHHAIAHVMALFAEVTVRPDPRVSQEIEQLREAWKRTLDMATFDRIQRYYEGLDATTRRELGKADNAQRVVYNQFAEAGNDRTALEAAKAAATRVATMYEQLGHAWRAAEMWSVAASIIAKYPGRTLEERREGVTALQRFKELMESWSWNDGSIYLQNIAYLKAEQEGVELGAKEAEKRKDAGYAPDAAGAERLVMPNATEEVADLKFKMVPKLQEDTFVRGGEVPALWLTVEVLGGPRRMDHFKGADLFMVCPGANKYGVTLDGTQTDMKKNPWQEVSAKPRPEPTLFYLGENKTDPYAMFFFVGGEQESLMGIKQNLAPQPDRAVVRYRSASSWVTTINGEQVTFYDDNANGKLFEESALDYGLIDRTIETGKDLAVPAYDSMQIGKGPLQPWSPFAKIGEQWFHLRAQKDGTAVGARPLNPEFFFTGHLRLDWHGKTCKPDVLIVRGNGDFAATAFNLVGGKPVEVPAGEYEVSFGRVSDAKGAARGASAHVYRGQSPKFTVEKDKTLDLALGEPFHLTFEKKVDGDTLVLDTLQVHVQGMAGELYTRINGAVPEAEVLAAKSKDGKGAKVVGELVPITDGDFLNEVARKHTVLGNEVGFFPVVKGEKESPTTLKAKLPAPDAFVGLQDKKNKLFGKMAPVFQ